MRILRMAVLVAAAAVSMLLVPASEAACGICQENQGAWICVYTTTRIKCLVDGDTCTMTLVSSCGAIDGECRSPQEILARLGLPEGWSETSKGTLWLPMKGPNDPAVLSKITFGSGATIRGGELLNRSSESIAGYQLGLVVVKRGGRTSEVVRGPVVDSTVPIKAKEIREMPPQLLESPLFKDQPAVVGVFLLEVRFADGSSWHADVARIQSEAESLVRTRGKKSSSPESSRSKKSFTSKTRT